MTSGSSLAPFSVRHLRAADSHSLNTIARHATRLPLPFVRRCRSRTVANVLSIGFLVRRCRLPFGQTDVEGQRLALRDFACLTHNWSGRITA